MASPLPVDVVVEVEVAVALPPDAAAPPVEDPLAVVAPP
jgi:hypothetical protein